jgi:hypothetical protein
MKVFKNLKMEYVKHLQSKNRDQSKKKNYKKKMVVEMENIGVNGEMNLSYEDLIIWFYDYKNCDDSLSEAKII